MQHPDVYAHLHAYGDWEMLWEAVAPLLQRGGVPDIEGLESRIRQDRTTVPSDLKAGLETLFRQVKNFMCQHPGLVDLETITLLDDVRAQLDHVRQAFTGPAEPGDIVAAIKPLARRMVDNHLRCRNAKVTEAALPGLRFQRSPEPVSQDDIVALVAEGRTIIVKGELGLGKTTLLLELAGRLSAVNADPSPANRLRAALLRIAHGEGDGGEGAKQLLAEINRNRDEYGLSLEERRHPDLHSGMKWPM